MPVGRTVERAASKRNAVRSIRNGSLTPAWTTARPRGPVVQVGAGLLLRPACLRDPGPSMEARRLGARTDPGPALEDAGRLARPEPQRGLHACVEGAPLSSQGRELRRRRALSLPVARARQEVGPLAADDDVALSVAIAAEGSRSRSRALPRRTPHCAHAPGREGTTGLGHPGADGTRLARDDADLQPHPAQGARRGGGRPGAVVQIGVPAT